MEKLRTKIKIEKGNKNVMGYVLRDGRTGHRLFQGHSVFSVEQAIMLLMAYSALGPQCGHTALAAKYDLLVRENRFNKKAARNRFVKAISEKKYEDSLRGIDDSL